MAPDLGDIEEKWQERWSAEGAYEPSAEPGRPKFFATYPYSYMNSFAHVGHAYTMTRNDLTVRYQRMLGKNTLFPFAYHVTGTPIVAAANRVAEGEPTQMKILRDQGIPEETLPQFADPAYWVEFFPKEWRQDVTRLGTAIDWRREFHTTELNPAYDKFIRWQFRKLREKGLVEKGRHPVVWCPKDESPVADHDRVEGEGETPQEWALIKLELVDASPEVDEAVTGPAEGAPTYLCAATLRPDTMFGQTNLWVDAEGAYVQVLVDGERWIVNEKAADKIAFQKENAERIDGADIPGSALVNLRVHAPARDADVPVLPAGFVRHDRGTGIVTSVPSDAPYDLMALRDLAEGRGDYPGLTSEQLERARELAAGVEPIPIIETPKYGNVAAEKAVEEFGAESQADKEALDDATDAVYKAGFYNGTLLDTCGPFAGREVADAKEDMRAWLTETGGADVLYETSGPVVCRCLTPSVVKMVSDQWFIRYGDEAWKAQTHAALDKMDIHPPIAKKQFHHVVDWLHDWACARESGLGTRLPWDEGWLIESLSDSTIYMAYYTIAPYLEGDWVKPDDLSDAAFDYIFHGKGAPETAAKGSLTAELLMKMREEFQYWYPVDFRNSGKDLLQNHLTFFVFNHVAMWAHDPAKWPHAIGVNGWVMVDGEKMSKSKGNFITLRQALDEYGTSATRMALANAGEGLDDANFDREFAHVITRRLERWLDLATNPPEGLRDAGDAQGVDAWFLSTLQRLIDETTEHMEATNYRSALKTGFFDLQREWSWYVRRSGGQPRRDVYDAFVDAQNRILTPFVPHIAEEVHAHRGGDGLAIDQPWPEVDADLQDPAAEAAESYVRSVLDDVKEILKVTGMAPGRIILYTAPQWKRAIYQTALGLAQEDDLHMGALMGKAMENPDVTPHAKQAPKVAQQLVKDLANLGADEARERAKPLDEQQALEESVPFLEAEFDATVEVHPADGDDVPDPAGKARQAMPRRPAIYVEEA